MAVFSCKMCGGQLDVNIGDAICTCEYCGSTQTLPKLNDERKSSLYDRANHFRRNNDFDKAMSIYEQILTEDSEDAESYWSIVLCRYGIEYVEDPVSHNRIPTVNRTQYSSIYADENYKAAIEYADPKQRELYENEAKVIDDIQKGILEISQKEEPFDVFICYKETDENGQRTNDSVIANDIYHQLTSEGLKVFFAAITLEDKLGRAYEPYIFAALNSAKVMIVLGTKPQYFVAPWVKNEWSRFLTIIQKDHSKILIPAYRGMDPYDLPEEFSFLQAQDMAKIGFMNDLIRGIKKVVGSNKETAATVVKTEQVMDSSSGVEALIKRANIFLEDGDWNNANIYFEKVLDIQPESASAYIGKLLVELRARNTDNLSTIAAVIEEKDNYIKAYKFADTAMKSKLEEYALTVKENLYQKLIGELNVAESERDYEVIRTKFEKISEYKDVRDYIQKAVEGKTLKHNEMVYTSAKEVLDNGETYDDYNKAAQMFEEISGYKDADELHAECLNRIAAIDGENKCFICHKGEGAKVIIANEPKLKCCDGCYNGINIITQCYGLENPMAISSVQFLQKQMSNIVHDSARKFVGGIVDKYIASVPNIRGKFETQKQSKSNVTAYDLEKERIRKETELQKKKDAEKREIQQNKEKVLDDNAKYEYKVADFNSTMADADFSIKLEAELNKYGAEGWRYNEVIVNHLSNRAMIVFDRRIKKEK